MENCYSSRIKELREKHSWSQAQFAEKLQTSVPTVWRIEKGERAPSADLIMRIVEICGCDLEWLMTGKGKAKEKSDESAKRQLLSLIKRDEKFRAEILTELSLRPPGDVIRNPRVYNFLQSQRADWQETREVIAQCCEGGAESPNNDRDIRLKKTGDAIAYLDVLLEVGRDPEE